MPGCHPRISFALFIRAPTCDTAAISSPTPLETHPYLISESRSKRTWGSRPKAARVGVVAEESSPDQFAVLDLGQDSAPAAM